MTHKKYMDLKSICKARRSVRTYSDQPIPPEYIIKIKEIAATSPYASGKKNWEIIALDNKESIHKIAQLVKEHVELIGDRIRSDFREGYTEYVKNFTFFQDAPLLFILTFRIPYALSLMLDQKDPLIAEWEKDNFVKSISCVAMLVLLAVESLGLGGCYMTGPLLAEKQIKEFLDIKKEKMIGALIPIGFPKNEVHDGY